jgi:predicted enzyme related to lactoylglutathione lyase
MVTTEFTHPIFRPNGISYLEIPADDVSRSSAFYHNVFGWIIRGDSSSPSFEDGTGHVIGHWKTGLSVGREAGIVPYIYVDSVDYAVDKINASGGEIVKAPYQEGDLRVATFRDPAGNLFGVWKQDKTED